MNTKQTLKYSSDIVSDNTDDSLKDMRDSLSHLQHNLSSRLNGLLHIPKLEPDYIGYINAKLSEFTYLLNQILTKYYGACNELDKDLHKRYKRICVLLNKLNDTAKFTVSIDGVIETLQCYPGIEDYVISTNTNISYTIIIN